MDPAANQLPTQGTVAEDAVEAGTVAGDVVDAGTVASTTPATTTNDGEYLFIYLVCWERNLSRPYVLKPTDQLTDIMQDFCKKLQVPFDHSGLYHDGQLISLTETPQKLSMENGGHLELRDLRREYCFRCDEKENLYLRCPNHEPSA